jgi:hypothetical protein
MRMGWAEHLVHMGNMKVEDNLGGIGNIKMDHEGIRWKDAEWINLAHTNQLQTVANMTMELRFV